MATQTTTKALNELPLKKLIAEPLSAAAQSHLEISRANVDAIKGILSEGNQDFSFKFP